MKTKPRRLGHVVLVLILLGGMGIGTAAGATGSPPIAPPLVREGDYAVRLAYALRVVTTDNETEAAARLGEVGITPRNGWLADYPVTPDILAEVQNSVAASADSGKLGMQREEALRYTADVNSEFGLAVFPAEGGYPSGAVQPSPDTTVINNYYTQAGPPVVTYYAPPAAYVSLYAWVPSPFWCAGFRFPGFYILHDFHRPVIIQRRTVYISNRFRDGHDRRFYRVDPIARYRGGFRTPVETPRVRPLVHNSNPVREKGTIVKLDERMKALRPAPQRPRPAPTPLPRVRPAEPTPVPRVHAAAPTPLPRVRPTGPTPVPRVRVAAPSARSGAPAELRRREESVRQEHNSGGNREGRHADVRQRNGK